MNIYYNKCPALGVEHKHPTVSCQGFAMVVLPMGLGSRCLEDASREGVWDLVAAPLDTLYTLVTLPVWFLRAAWERTKGWGGPRDRTVGSPGRTLPHSLQREMHVSLTVGVINHIHFGEFCLWVHLSWLFYGFLFVTRAYSPKHKFWLKILLGWSFILFSKLSLCLNSWCQTFVHLPLLFLFFLSGTGTHYVF